MKLQKFVDILDQDGIVASDFFEKEGIDVFKTDELLLMLLKESMESKTWYKLTTLGWIIALEKGRKCCKEKTYFDDILPVYSAFNEYIRGGCHFFGNKLIPWEEWEDLAKEQVDILKILIEKNQLKSFRRTKMFHEFADKCSKRADLFVKKGYLNDCDFDVPSGL